MARDWESTFREWAKPPGVTEQQKSDNAERTIRAAIKDSHDLSKRDIIVFPQGSYRNNTNVRHDSDVDICVLCKDVFYYDLPEDNTITKQAADIGEASYEYSDFKNEVETALVRKFGRDMVKRGNKAFDIHENSYRVDADAVACFGYREYFRDIYGQIKFREGTQLHPDNGGIIRNWPEQHYRNGVDKNSATSTRFKSMVRIIKRLRNEMEENGVQEAKSAPSFLIESLVWNTPNNHFGNFEYVADIRNVLAHTFNETINIEKCREWTEINEIKYLFHFTQPWTLQQAHSFLSAAWDYIGFK
jgi:hypothetical protein